MDAARAEEFSQQILLPVMPAIRMADVDELGKRLEGLVAGNERELVRAAHAYAAEEALRITDRRTYQAMEAFVHNLNTMNSRAGAQVPFSSVNYGTDTSAEGRMVVRNLLLATQAGLGSGETSIFPVQIFKVKEGVNYNEGDPNYDLFKMAIKTSAMRLFPNFSFLDAPFNLQYYKPGDYNSEVAYMGCRTRVLGNVYDPDRQVTCGRGNLSFTSINLPRLGIEARGDQDRFFQLLDDQIDLVFRQLLHRFDIQCSKKVRNYPFLMGNGIWLDSEKLDWDDSVAEVLRHGTLTVGFIGLAETLVELDGDTCKNLEAFETIIRFMHDKGVGYGSINHPLDRDPVCGYVGVINGQCPRCGRKEGEAVSQETLKMLRRKYPHMPRCCR